MHNKKAIEGHSMASRIEMIQGSSIDPMVIENVRNISSQYEKIMVLLDSNHTHDHVLAELQAYALLTSLGSYCVVFDTIVEDMSSECFQNRPWGPGNSPKTAVFEYLSSHPQFQIDKTIDHKLLISVAPDGYLKRVSV
jgi:cephalosporin hydroxylase